MNTLEQKLVKKIDSCEVISFDVFDTALLRNVIEPIDVFGLVKKEYEYKFGPYLQD